MAIFGGITQVYVVNNGQTKLAALRKALEDVKDMYLWLAAYSPDDLMALGFSSPDASDILAAFADANALYEIYTTGQAPGTYPQVTGPYVYAASQRIVIGPLS